jgi:murein DD-endopeptidase MepM/ murein hydrolase activator NlpD
VRAKWLLPVAGIVAALAGVLVHVHLAGASSYLVQPGDTLSDLAARLGVPMQELADANGITDPNFIVAGKMLVVPSDGGSATEYVVRKGDTLSGISARLGVPVADIARANGLEDVNSVPADRLLSIPPVGTSTPGVPNLVVNAAAGHYTVRSGDSLSAIADRLGVPLGQLAAANGIANPNLITEGEVITAPNVWECPVPEATFVDDYGYVEADGGFHAGVDMFAPRGTPIQAPVSGTAVEYPNPAGGNGLELYGNDGNRYYLAHLDSYGDIGSVSAGDVVGYVGNTGDAATTSTHLHFEIHPGGGDSVNPFPTLVAACR